MEDNEMFINKSQELIIMSQAIRNKSQATKSNFQLLKKELKLH